MDEEPGGDLPRTVLEGWSEGLGVGAADGGGSKIAPAAANYLATFWPRDRVLVRFTCK